MNLSPHQAPTDTRTVVLDDDPTGSQCASGVQVLFEWGVADLRDALRSAPAVYVLTNTRAVDAATAVGIVRAIRRNALAAAVELGATVRFVLRGDSTLRGHVFAESEELMTPASVLLFAPAFPAGGRTTVDNVHYVMTEGGKVPAADTEFAADPVFPFTARTLAEYVAEKSSRTPVTVPLSDVRAGNLATALLGAPAGSVVLPDIVTDADVAEVANAVEIATAGGREIVVRSGAPLAAHLAGVVSTRPYRPAGTARSALLVCGSHTAASTAQLETIERRWGAANLLSTTQAVTNPEVAGLELARRASERSSGSQLALLATERTRAEAHGTLDHGSKVMAALMHAVAILLPDTDLVISKGGITSAEVARTAMAATSAHVLGQIRPGISVWELTDSAGRRRQLVVVPGNVGDRETLAEIIGEYGLVPPREEVDP